MHQQYALVEDGTTIHSSLQMEWNQVSVDDQSKHMGGHQQILTLDGYQIPLNMCHGLAYMDMCPFTDDDWDSLPHVALTLKTPWDPQVLDLEQSDDPDWFEHADDPPCSIRTLMHMEIILITLPRVQCLYLLMMRPSMLPVTITPPPGPLLWKKPLMALLHLVCSRLMCTILSTAAGSQTHLDPGSVKDDMFSLHHGPCKVIPTPRDYDVLCPLFTWLPHDIVKKSFVITTQYIHLPHNTVLHTHFKLPNPALNIQCHIEDIATNTIESNVPAIDGGQKYTQIFIGTTLLLTNICPLKGLSMFPSILSDHIIDHGTLLHTFSVTVPKWK
jgi:hypothetical protein